MPSDNGNAVLAPMTMRNLRLLAEAWEVKITKHGDDFALRITCVNGAYRDEHDEVTYVYKGPDLDALIFRAHAGERGDGR